MSMNRSHEPFEELISASLRGDLTRDERQRLDLHLDGCPECRATLASFADQRRIVAGLRHVAPPRDLDARIRTAIEPSATPWWRRPPAIFAGVGGGLAVVAGAVFALVLLNGSQNPPPVGNVSPTPSQDVAPSSTSPAPTLPPPATPIPSGAPVASSPPAATPSQEPTPEPSPEPQVFLALTGPADNLALTVRDGTSPDDTIMEPDTPSGEPIAAVLSPDGQWLAYITVIGESGLTEVRATRVAAGEPVDAPEAPPPIDSPIEVGETVLLGESVAGSPFLEHLFWSADSRSLAYTLADPDGEGTDVWVFQPEDGEPEQRTDVGNAYAGSWALGGAGTAGLWVSTAGGTPLSYLMVWHDDAGPITAGDPADSEFPPATNVFQPIISPNSAFVIFWSGRMSESGDEWLFREGGAPWLANNAGDGQGGYEFTDAREVFSDVTLGRDAFTSAAIAWGGDSDAYAVWEAAWTGLPQAPSGPYPDRERVYFGHATDPRGLTRIHAIDEGDLPDDTFVVDVKVSPTGRHLVITAAYPRAGVLDPPRADLLLVERNTGSVADQVSLLNGNAEGWYGPAAFDELP
jgi:hypothetical protein